MFISKASIAGILNYFFAIFFLAEGENRLDLPFLVFSSCSLMSFFAISSVGQPYFGLQEGKDPKARMQINIPGKTIELFLLMRIFYFLIRLKIITNPEIFYWIARVF